MIRWERKAARIWTAIVDVRFEQGLLTTVRPVALRIAPERMPECTGRYVLDYKSMAILPWTNAGGALTFATKADAVRYAKRYLSAMSAQATCTPKVAA